MSRRLNEIKANLNSQIQDAITTAIANIVLPSIQNTLEMNGRANFTMVDRKSTGPHPGPKATNSAKMEPRSRKRPENVGNHTL